MKRLLLILLFLSCSAVAEDYDTLIKQGIDARNQGQFARAESLLRQAYADARVKTEAAYLLAMVIAFQERFTEALVLIDKQLKIAPEDRDLLTAKARVLSYQGNYTEAERILTKLRDNANGDIELNNLVARISLYQNQPLKARALYLQSLAQAPDDLDTLIGLHDTFLQFGEIHQAEIYLDRAATIAPEHADVLLRSGTGIEIDITKHEFILGGDWSRFDVSGFNRWRDYFFEYRHTSQPGRQKYIRVDRANHFGESDTQLTAGIVTRVGHMPVEVSVSVANDPVFLPKQSLFATTNLALGTSGRFVLRPNLRLARYQSGTTTRLGINADYYFTTSNTWATFGVGVVDDENGDRDSSWQIGLNHQLSSSVRIGLDYTDAPETDLNITTETTTWHSYLRWQFADQAYVRFDLSQHDRRSQYQRTSAAITISRRF